MMKLPKSDFKWLGEDEIEDFDVNSLDLEGDLGYIVECDLHYPKKLHKKHNNFTLAPECLEINSEHLSPYAKEALVQSGCREQYKDSKLVTTFHDRKNYVVHAKLLKLYLDLGLKLTKIHRVIQFHQEAFIAPYIEMCTKARQKSTNKFDISQYKKLANVIFGKTIENVRDYATVKLHTTKDSALKAISKHNYKSHVIISKNLVQTNHYNDVVLLNKPIAIGVTILELVRNLGIFFTSF